MVPQELRIQGHVRCDTMVGCDCRAYYMTTNVGNVICSYRCIYIVFYICIYEITAAKKNTILSY